MTKKTFEDYCGTVKEIAEKHAERIKEDNNSGRYHLQQMCFGHISCWRLTLSEKIALRKLYDEQIEELAPIQRPAKAPEKGVLRTTTF